MRALLVAGGAAVVAVGLGGPPAGCRGECLAASGTAEDPGQQVLGVAALAGTKTRFLLGKEVSLAKTPSAANDVQLTSVTPEW